MSLLSAIKSQSIGYTANVMMQAEKRRLNRALIDAVLESNADAAVKLLNAGACVHATDFEHSETALMLAAQFADTQMIQVLLDQGADIGAMDVYGKTALFHAAISSANFDLLLKHGANIHVRDKDERTILIHIIASAPPVEIIEKLIRKGIDPNLKDVNGNSALSLSKAYGLVRISQLLESIGVVE